MLIYWLGISLESIHCNLGYMRNTYDYCYIFVVNVSIYYVDAYTYIYVLNILN